MTEALKPNEPGFWQQQYEAGTTGWDAGAITTPLKEYFESLTDKKIKILIPGAGNGWEATWLDEHGFTNVFVLDIAPAPLQNIMNRVPDFPKSNLILGDFFSHEGSYDLIAEQTFFCAIDPSMRTKYVETVHRLLKPGGMLAGVLFDFPLTEAGPPYGGSQDEYRTRFSPLFRFLTFEPCYNSIAPRAGRELFIRFQKAA